MRPFFIRLQAKTGMTNQEVAAWLDVSIKTIESWRSGKKLPQSYEPFERIIKLIHNMELEANKKVQDIDDNPAPKRIELVEPKDDIEALAMGWPYQSVYKMVIADILAQCPEDLDRIEIIWT